MEQILGRAELRVTHQLVEAHEVVGVVHLLVVSDFLWILLTHVCIYLVIFDVICLPDQYNQHFYYPYLHYDCYCLPNSF